jgi:KipI family sensor histidine kinase inhibitor
MDESRRAPTIQHASDHSLLVVFGEEISLEAHQQVRRLLRLLEAEPLAGVQNLHPAYASLLVSYDPRQVERALLEREVAARLASVAGVELPEPRLVDIPVCYGGELGPDLGEVASAAGLAPDDVVNEHAAGDYLVYFLGFSPGFPYLGGMSERIAAPRRATPRRRVPPGSVAIGGSQTGVYPLSSPGGWQLIGRTPLALFDPARRPASLLATGDRVRFVPVALPEFERLAAPRATGGSQPSSAPEGQIRVVEPGFQTTVQDPGRRGHAHIGVSASGAADALSLRIGNWLVGNSEGAPALEMTLVGGKLHFASHVTIALVGSDFGATIDGLAVPQWAAFEVPHGETLEYGPTRSGARCYLCVRGGFTVPSLLGSASTHLTTGLGGFEGRALRAGDVLGVAPFVGRVAPARRFPRELAVPLLRRDVVRVTRGAQWEWFSEEARVVLFAGPYAASEDCSRMGLRLRGSALPARRQGVMLTEGVSLGSLQVPGDGQPIISFVEHQTTGGYPQIACVIAADLHRVGQLRPRDQVRFEEVSFEEADDALRQQEAMLLQYLETAQ